MSWKVLITASPIHEVGQEAMQLLEAGGCEVIAASPMGPLKEEALIEAVAGVDAVVASIDQYSAKVLESPAARGLKLISRWGVGYDCIDVPAATRVGIVIAYTPGMLNEAVADHAFALLLGVARRVADGDRLMRRGGWEPIWGHDVAGKTLGVIGCGRIGQAVARRARGFDMPVLGFDIAPDPRAEEAGIRFVEIGELLARSDFVSLHAALTTENRELMGERQLRGMKPSASLINTARGALVDEGALARALQEGWIAGAALDTFVVEPLSAGHPLRSAPNLLMTPHLASYSRETGAAVSRKTAEAVLDLMAGCRPELVLNAEVFQSPALRAGVK
jgi:phosphoglycerate dehydrogenase-like enzyme